MKYLVRTCLSTFYNMEVEANNEREALEEASEYDNWDSQQITDNLELLEGESSVLLAEPEEP